MCFGHRIFYLLKIARKYDTMAAQANRDYKTKQTKTLEYEKFSTDELPI